MSAAYCDNCFKGAEGSDSTNFTTFGGVKCYVARPEGKTTAGVLLCTDVFGAELLQNRKLADKVAKEANVLCVIPDQFDGDALTESFDWTNRDNIMAWFGKHPQLDKMPRFEAALKEMREKEGIKKVGIMGFCYGAKVPAVLAATDKIDAVALCHPTRVEVPEDVQPIKTNNLWLFAEIDNAFPKEKQEETQAILSKRTDIKSTFKTFPGVEHGFVIRGDESVEHIKKAKAEAQQDLVNFFKAELH